MRKIAVFTGTRAEYGLLYWVIKGLHESTEVELQLYVGGMHLSPEFGYTINQIEKDGFPVTERMEFLLSSDSPVGITKSMGLALINSAEVLDRNKPDLIVLLGDRFESMTVAQAAMVACIPVAHIHGGEKTEGLIDEAVRHSITKMSHLHFAATGAYQNRIQQLGEQPERTFNFGAPGIDSIVNLQLLKREELSDALDFALEKPFFMVTYHPVTLEIDGASESLVNLLKVLDDYPNHQLIITYPNADTHGRKLIEILDEYHNLHPERVLLTRSLGQLRYLSAMKYCDAVIGNSSSGLIETPTFNVPTVNIGNRQKGRIAGETVLHCNETLESIRDTIGRAVSADFTTSCETAVNPYGIGNSSERIVDQVINYPLEGIVNKKFYDLSL
ncbi:UDP-N-acetylglucosamine 2-epimerase (hydrolyzing) [Colwellia demingiae]|uniref:UDP-N-acetylglucosamine 2-epimerase (Hydrolyzing) n=1 Tax=Colwellia demingiae TaxID=89401 RepID=A0A5C6QT07_9GAMM|nr:UDP-N-acetylglucosamine 2-epimerase [Colwellia demingiae]TWX71937.1 UDP-N-acetylglucosamine 2-epimerase (hydrolyzing) [Colwellia demingiae]